MTTTLYASIAAADKSAIIKRMDIYRESLNGIGRFELLFDNTGNVLTGTASQSAVELKIDTVSLMKGYVDDYIPTVKGGEAVYLEEAKVMGRDYGQDLANIVLSHDYYSFDFDDILENALASNTATWVPENNYILHEITIPTADNGLSYSCVVPGDSAVGEPTWPTTFGAKVVDGTVTWMCVPRSEITYISPSNGPAIDYSFKDEYLLNGFKDIMKQVNYDFWVLDTKVLKVVSISAPESSDVTLKSKVGDAADTVLALDPIGEKVGLDIRNYIKVKAGDVNDHFTEGTAGDFTVHECSAAEDDSSIFISGYASIKAAITLHASYPKLYLEFPKYNYSFLDFSVKGSISCSALVKINTGASTTAFKIYAMDDSANEIVYEPPNAIEPNVWTKVTFPMGLDVSISSGAGNWTALVGAGPFTWNVTHLGVMFASADSPAYTMYIDGLNLPEFSAFAVSTDATSKTTYRTRMITLNRPDLKSQNQLQAVADDELAKRKNPTQKLKLTCIGNTALKYAGQLLGVLAPSSGIGLANQVTTNDGSVDGTTVLDSSITEASDTWNYSFMKILSGTCIGQTRLITDWDLAIFTFTTLAFSARIELGVSYEIYSGYRILSLHHAAEPHTDVFMGHDFITELELVKHTSSPDVQALDPLRFKLGENPNYTLLRRLEERVRALERA